MWYTWVHRWPGARPALPQPTGKMQPTLQTPGEDQRLSGNQHFIELSSPRRNLFQQILFATGITDTGVWPALPPLRTT